MGTVSSLESDEIRWRPGSDAEKQQVRDQLKKLLASPNFASSHRYPNLLRFVVEQTLAGQEDALKERLLGFEVFHRAPDYDTNQDPVVRLSAAEVRKRIALYYQQPEHQHELVIGLNPGSYIPFFRPAEAASAQPHSGSPDSVQEAQPKKTALRRSPWPYAAASLLICIVAFSLARYFFLRPSVSDQFWSPVFASSSRVTVCVGSPDVVDNSAQIMPPPSSVFEKIRHSGRLGTANVVTLMRLGGTLESLHKPFRLELAYQAGFPELHEGPVILVGALDNPWTMRMTQSLRYGFGLNEDAMYIVDHKNPSARNWSVSLKQSPSSQSTDFALIARYQDNTLDQPVVLVAGLSSEGTEAAGEVLSDPRLLKTLFQNGPRNWDTVNLEAVVQTQVIEGHPGPSRVIAVEYW